MFMKMYRRGSARCMGLLATLLTVVVCLYYISLANQTNGNIATPPLPNSQRQYQSNMVNSRKKDLDSTISRQYNGPYSWQQCPKLVISNADINTVTEHAKFDFQPTWMRSKEFWDKTFEQRYENQKLEPKRPPLKVFLIPHSHNDPGWLKTFEHYFQSDTRNILNSLVKKMNQYKDLTFIWTEISFLQMWWDQVHPTKRKAFKELVKSGRLEITTGGWVMTDEANSHLFAMLDQLIEGHQWVQNNLNITPVSGWSIDPFGHGSTVPYLLSNSGVKGAIIQRIHYAWKHWFAMKQYGDFYWIPGWTKRTDDLRNRRNLPNLNDFGDSISGNFRSMMRTKREINRDDGKRGNRKTPGTLLMHNMPFDIYSIKHSCGPHPFNCINFDFRKIKGEYTEYSIKAQFIDEKNVKSKAEFLLEQYSRAASLFPHNVAMALIGDDFRYNHEIEFDQQYTNYKLLIDYINKNYNTYNTKIQFGTPKDYFREILQRYDDYPTLTGDFFVYSDIFSEGRPAYWSGYFTTRPFMKILCRELEHNLRNAEILFTIAVNDARQNKHSDILRLLEKHYEQLVIARRNLGLFQHHDAITGTSKAIVMRDYGLKLFEGIQDSVRIQQYAIESLLTKSDNKEKLRNFILHDMERESYDKIPRKVPITMSKNQREIVLFNSLAQTRNEVVQIRTNSSNVTVLDWALNEIQIQINPVWNATSLALGKLEISDKEFEVMFIATLSPLSLTTYYLMENYEHSTEKMLIVYCNDCVKKNKNISKTKSIFEIRNTQPGDIQLENHNMRLLIDGQTGFLKTITKKYLSKSVRCGLKFAAYHSAQFHSGAYLFKPDPNTIEPEKDVLEQYSSNLKLVITSGPIASELTVIYGPFLTHSIRIYNSKNTSLSDAIYIENSVDFEMPPKNRETELFMRFQTDIENGDPPVFYTDSSGFQFQKRVKVPDINIEGNYFPITTMAFMQDADLRLTLITNHAQGAASFEPGYLEVMLDRRTLYDDARGMGEGVVDNKLTSYKYWLVLETVGDQNLRDASSKFSVDSVDVEKPRKFNFKAKINPDLTNDYQLPSIFVNHLSNSLNYPVNIFSIENPEDVNIKLKQKVSLVSQAFPCDVHLLNLRTKTDDSFPQFPSTDALMVLHRQGYSCMIGKDIEHNCENLNGFRPGTQFESLEVKSMTLTSLTGLENKESLEELHMLEIDPMTLQTVQIMFKD